MLGMSFPRLPFLYEQQFRQDVLRFFCEEQEMGPQETTCEYKFFCTGVYVHRWKDVLNWRFLAMSPEEWFCRSLEMRLGKKS